MRAIFISYRRDDSEGQAGRLYDDLARRFGEDCVFMDVAGIEPGLDFRKVIDRHVASCGVLLAVIGPTWTEAKNEKGERRLDNPLDFVRLETASALKRDIPVIPVLVHGARMPRTEQLPDDLKELTYRNGLELTQARWDSDVEVLIKALKRHIGDAEADPGAGSAGTDPLPDPPAVPIKARRSKTAGPGDAKSRQIILVAAGAAVALVVAVLVYVLSSRTHSGASTPGQRPSVIQPIIQAFSASPVEVTRGDKVTVHWDVANADDVELEPFGHVGSSGSTIDQPRHTTIYKLSATNKTGGRNGTFQEVIVNEPNLQTGLPQPSATPAIPSFTGTWLNDNSATGSVVKLIISEVGSRVKVHAFGSCHPTPCDWGTQPGTVDNGAATVAWDQGFVKRNMTLTLTASGHLSSTLDSVYNDKRGTARWEDSFHRAE
jgi:hypothetical protein